MPRQRTQKAAETYMDRQARRMHKSDNQRAAFPTTTTTKE